MINPKTMTAGLLFGLAALMALPESASAQYYPPPPYYRVYRRRVIVVRPPPPPPQRLVVVQPRPVQPAPRREYQSDLLGIGVRVSGIALDGQKLGLRDFENPAMGGVGVQLRSRVTKWFGLELSADFLFNNQQQEGYKQRTIPVMLSGIVYLFPTSSINPYLLAGVGVHFTNLSYLDGAFEHNMLEFAAQAGLGVQVKFGRHFAIHADVRFVSVYKNLDSVTYVSNQCLSSKAAGRPGFCEGLSALNPDEDKWNIGIQFGAGATYFF